MARAQGALEYLIILGVVVAVVAIVSMIVVNSFGQKQNGYLIASCASAASSCNSILIANSTASCDFCDTSCIFSNDTEVFPKAIDCCKQGKSKMIYDGSPGC